MKFNPNNKHPVYILVIFAVVIIVGFAWLRQPIKNILGSMSGMSFLASVQPPSNLLLTFSPVLDPTIAVRISFEVVDPNATAVSIERTTNPNDNSSYKMVMMYSTSTLPSIVDYFDTYYFAPQERYYYRVITYSGNVADAIDGKYPDSYAFWYPSTHFQSCSDTGIWQ